MTFPGTVADPALASAFKNVFRRQPAGVAIITASGPSGPVGLTASSVSSVSAEPPVLVFSLSAASGSAATIAGADSFVVHLLDSNDLEAARRFARPGSNRFNGDIPWELLPTGEPLLTGVTRWLRCRPLEQATVGGSTVVIASVLDIHGEESSHPGLVYTDRTFHWIDTGTALPQ
ncbi:MAG: putative oxidoreductase [Micrococcaceae bacterium]|jgi:flavin reductase (DIM6/NTAB) family NADH-FMN oxidoreductase RutF|nr:putative oxidoreductase [Micrococcaceae bacterium]